MEKNMGKIAGFFAKQKNFIKDIYKTYTATIVSALILTIIFVVFNHVDKNDFYEHAVVILLLFFAWSFFFESCFYKKASTLSRKLYSLCAGAVASLILEIIYYCIMESNTFISISKTCIIYFLTFYIIFFIGCALFTIIKKQDITFHEYLARVVFGLLRALGLFLSLYVAAVLLLELFDNLIVSIDYWDILNDAEIILAGLIYFPVCLVTLVKTEEENSRFTKAVVTYAFMPCIMLAMLVIYIYIIKIFITWQIPSNEIFSICAYLFVIGAPVWTMAYAFSHEKNNIYTKLIKYMKFIYTPFIFLEIYAISVRISYYGVTESRYAGAAFIAFQIIYILWEMLVRLYKKLRKKERQPLYGRYYEYMILVLVAFAFIGMAMPGLNATYVSYLSQKKIFAENVDSNVKRAYEAYVYLDSNPYGINWLERNCTKDELLELQKKYYDNIEDSSALKWKYVSVRNENLLYSGFDVSGYNTLYNVTCGYSNAEYTREAYESIALKIDGQDYMNIDLTDCLLYYAEIDENRDEYNDDEKIYCMEIDENHRLYICYARFDYLEGMTVIKNLNITGYLLEK